MAGVPMYYCPSCNEIRDRFWHCGKPNCNTHAVELTNITDVEIDEPLDPAEREAFRESKARIRELNARNRTVRSGLSEMQKQLQQAKSKERSAAKEESRDIKRFEAVEDQFSRLAKELQHEQERSAQAFSSHVSEQEKRMQEQKDKAKREFDDMETAHRNEQERISAIHDELERINRRSIERRRARNESLSKERSANE